MKWISALFLFPLGACAGGSMPLGGPEVIGVTNHADLPPPTSSDMFTQGRPYLVGPFDKLVVDVFGIEGMDKREIQTDVNGRFSFPLIGTVDAGGRTPSEIEALMRGKLQAAYIRNPQVTVNLKETVSQVVTVEGQVNEPGQYPVLGHMTLLRAVARAKGMTEYAKLDDIVVFRQVNGQKYAGLYNLKAIRRGTYNDPEIYANDVIVVGNSQARRLFKDILQVVPLLTTPLIIALQQQSTTTKP
jgi:polysaccharide biosynthesis/export protein